MAAKTSASLLRAVCVCVCWTFALSQETETVSEGEDATLKCKFDLSRDDVQALTWNRPDLRSDEYVFFYREHKTNEKYQSDRFRGRVQLKDTQMTGGDVSVTLKNATGGDNGTYECFVLVQSSGRRKRAVEFSSFITLKVTESGHEGKGNPAADHPAADHPAADHPGSVHRHLGLVTISVVAVIVMMMVMVAVYGVALKRKRSTVKQKPGAADNDGEACKEILNPQSLENPNPETDGCYSSNLPSPASDPGSGLRGSSFSRGPQTSLSRATLTSSNWGILRRSQASVEISSLHLVLGLPRTPKGESNHQHTHQTSAQVTGRRAEAGLHFIRLNNKVLQTSLCSRLC